jgi:hypothetical protein
VIFVDYSCHDGFSAYSSKADHVPDGLRLEVRGPLLPGLMRPVAVVVDHVLAQHKGQVAFSKNQGPVQQFATEGPDDALADGVDRSTSGRYHDLAVDVPARLQFHSVADLLDREGRGDGHSPAQAAELTRHVRERLMAYASPAGVTMPGAAWVVTAHAA